MGLDRSVWRVRGIIRYERQCSFIFNSQQEDAMFLAIVGFCHPSFLRAAVHRGAAAIFCVNPEKKPSPPLLLGAPAGLERWS